MTDKISVGDSHELPIRWSERDVKEFVSLSGDTNIIHSDQEAAAKSPIPMEAIPGMLGAMAFSRVFGTILPGHGSVIAEQQLDFRRPVLRDKDYVVRTTVEELVPEKHGARIRSDIIDVVTGKVCFHSSSLVLHSDRL